MEMDQKAPESKESGTELVQADTANLAKESIVILNQIIAEQDPAKTKDLTYLFNQNQNKKTMARMNKLNDLVDTLVDKFIDRANNRPDEMTTTEIINGMKTASDLIDKGQKSINSEPEFAPLIQINSQDNSVNVAGSDDAASKLSKESKDRVTNVIRGLLSRLAANNAQETTNVIDITANEEGTEDNDD